MSAAEVASDTSLDGLSTSNVALIDEELAEHQRWGAAVARVGAAGSSTRAQFLASEYDAGLIGGGATGLVQGFAMGAAIKAIEIVAVKTAARLGGQMAAKSLPIPAIGAVIGGVMSAMDLAERDWGATGETIGKFGQGASDYEKLANSIAAISEIISVATAVLNVIAGIIGAISIVMWIITIVTLGVASPLAGTLSTIALYIGATAMVLDAINALVLQPLVATFRALHAFKSQGDPTEVEKQGEAIRGSGAASAGFVGGFAGAHLGGKAAEGGAKRLGGPPPSTTPHETPPPAAGDGPNIHADPPPAPVEGQGTHPADAPATAAAPVDAPVPVADAHPAAPADAAPHQTTPADAPAAAAVAPADAPASTAKPADAPAPAADPAHAAAPADAPASTATPADAPAPAAAPVDAAAPVADPSTLPDKSGRRPGKIGEVGRHTAEQGHRQGGKLESEHITPGQINREILGPAYDDAHYNQDKTLMLDEPTAEQKTSQGSTSDRKRIAEVQAKKAAGVPVDYTGEVLKSIDETNKARIEKNSPATEGDVTKGAMAQLDEKYDMSPDLGPGDRMRMAEQGPARTERVNEIKADLKAANERLADPALTTKERNAATREKARLEVKLDKESAGFRDRFGDQQRTREVAGAEAAKKGEKVLGFDDFNWDGTFSEKGDPGKPMTPDRELWMGDGPRPAKPPPKQEVLPGIAGDARFDERVGDMDRNKGLATPASSPIPTPPDTTPTQTPKTSGQGELDFSKPAPPPDTVPAAAPVTATPPVTTANAPTTTPAEQHPSTALPPGSAPPTSAPAKPSTASTLQHGYLGTLGEGAVGAIPGVEQVKKAGHIGSAWLGKDRLQTPASRRDVDGNAIPYTEREKSMMRWGGVIGGPQGTPGRMVGEGIAKRAVDFSFGYNKAASEPIVEHVSPNYPAPPGSLEEMNALQERLARILEARAQAEATRAAASADASHHQGNTAPLQRFDQGAQRSITASEAHAQATARRQTAQQQREQKEGDVSANIADYTQRKSGLSAIIYPLTGVQKFSGLASSMPDGILGFSTALVGPKRKILQINKDSSDFLNALAGIDAKMANEAATQPARTKEVADNKQKLQGVQTGAASSKATLTKAKTDGTALANRNQQRMGDSQRISGQASATGSQLDGEKAKTEADMTTLAGRWQSWAQSHAQSRATAIAATRKAMEAQRYRVREVNLK